MDIGMDMNILHPAKDVLDVANSFSKTGEQISQVAYSINSAARIGETSVTVVTHLSPDAIKEIREKGYRLTAVGGIRDEKSCNVWIVEFGEDAQKSVSEEEL